MSTKTNITFYIFMLSGLFTLAFAKTNGFLIAFIISAVIMLASLFLYAKFRNEDGMPLF